MLPTCPPIIRRQSTPNSYDQAPKGTLCVTNDGHIYKQISKDIENPQWDDVTQSISQQDIQECQLFTQ